MGLVIDKLYAWITIGDDGDEGVIGVNTGRQGWLPAVGADHARMESLRPVAQSVADTTGRAVILKVFSAGVAIDEINPIQR